MAYNSRDEFVQRLESLGKLKRIAYLADCRQVRIHLTEFAYRSRERKRTGPRGRRGRA
jgi:hypothetical protein